jgi:hypothetical protein
MVRSVGIFDEMIDRDHPLRKPDPRRNAGAKDAREGVMDALASRLGALKSTAARKQRAGAAPTKMLD